MLNQSRVLKYVKDHLAFDFNFIEKTDDEIIEHIAEYTVREFSLYFPQKKKLNLPLNIESNRVPGRANEFYLEEPEGIEILNVVDIYFPMGDWLLFGHPPLGPMSQGELRQWALDVEVAGMVKQFSSYDKTFQFSHPNIVRISPVPNNCDSCTVEYERMQPADLSGIPNDLQMTFCELALADIMILIGRIRKRYGDGVMRTPFGEIPLGSDIFEEGKEKKREVLELLKAGPMMNIIFDRG